MLTKEELAEKWAAVRRELSATRNEFANTRGELSKVNKALAAEKATTTALRKEMSEIRSASASDQRSAAEYRKLMFVATSQEGALEIIRDSLGDLRETLRQEIKKYQHENYKISACKERYKKKMI